MPKAAASAGQTVRHWKATPRQRAFLEAEEDQVLYGGAAGGGKTAALLVFGILRRLAIPRSKGLYLRRSYPELEMSVVGPTHELLEGTGAKWDGKNFCWRFPNGSVQYYSYLDRDETVYRYQSAEFEDICFDELTTFSEFQFTFMQARCRTTKPGVRTLIRAATNPLGVGYAWVKAAFVDPAPPETPFTVEIDLGNGAKYTKTRKFIPATVRDNPHLGPEYEASLAMLPERERRALLDGDWDILSGGVFAEFDKRIHVVDPFEIPPGWVRFVAYDHGYARPFCALWFAVDYDDNVYVYRELYGAVRPNEGVRWDVPVIAKAIRDRMQPEEPISYWVADPSIWTKTGTGPSIAELFLQSGIPFEPGDHNRVPGWAQVHHRLQTNRLKIFRTCEHLIRTLPALTPDPRNPEDVDSEGEDHAADALRYGLMSRPMVPNRPPKPKHMMEEYIEKLLNRNKVGRSWKYW